MSQPLEAQAPTWDVVIVGGGAAGGAAAFHLAKGGRSVVVLEQHDVPGGWCHSFRLGGQRLLGGKALLTKIGEDQCLEELAGG